MLINLCIILFCDMVTVSVYMVLFDLYLFWLQGLAGLDGSPGDKGARVGGH